MNDDIGLKTRAIYLPDIRCDEIPIFELRGSQFVCTTDEELRYDFDIVLYDKNFIVVSIDTDENEIVNIRY